MSNHFIPNSPHTQITRQLHGSTNSIERKTVTKNVSIDTVFRKNYNTTSSTNFMYTFPEPINNVVSMKIASTEIPFVWYCFLAADKSNEFTMTIRGYPTTNPIDPSNTTVERVTFRIPDGNYESSAFITAMNNYFKNLGNGFKYLFFDIEETSAKCIFRTKTFVEDSIYNNADLSMNHPNFSFDIDFTIESDPTRPIYKNAGWMLGFKKSFYHVERDPVGITDYIYSNVTISRYNWYLKGEACYGSGLVNYMLIELDDFQKNVSTNVISSNHIDSYIGNNIMARIQVVSGFNTILTNNMGDFVFKKREYFGPVKLEKMTIRLLNKFGDPINLNGNDFSMLLEIEQLYSQ